MGFPRSGEEKGLGSENVGYFCESWGFVILLSWLAQDEFCKQKGEGGKKNALERAGLFSSSTSGHVLLTLGLASVL